ncbi:transporter substrate-binding domain-containing protein [Trichococcus shcherbakoviae]|jgi:ABC-type amino acid transport substrate-binding protein|uniref:transporter substrate-binding domain-containing protein n=1 Tax=Trichococcus shcherbakoviae TaxID=2094020 RepID=UPI001B601A9C|nr:transporter substrate-binding domain-containing protein [Trichococcus shcherbakoviae]MBP7128358.1 transporter substrate-binding domain-containing protein [Trichococcus sp.]
MKKGLLKLVLGTMSILALAACGNTSDTADSSATDSAASTATTDKLQEIKDKGKLVMGTSADYPPYEWHLIKDGKDEIIGFDIDIAQAIADELGVELEVKDMAFDGLIPALSTGKIDMIIAGMNATEERKQSVDFTDVYYTQTDIVVIRKEDADKFTSEDSLKTAALATQKATVQETYLLETFPDAEIQSVPKWNTAIMSLTTGKVDAVMMVDTVAKQFIAQNDDLMVANFDINSTPNAAAIAVAKNGGDFLETVNNIVNEMKESGKIEELYQLNDQIVTDNTAE